MSKMSNHIVRVLDAPRPLADLERVEEIRRQEAPWEYGLTDEQLDSLDAPDGPLSGFDCYGEVE